MTVSELLQAIEARLNTNPFEPYEGDAYADMRTLLAIVKVQQEALEKLMEEYEPGAEDFVHHWVYCTAQAALRKADELAGGGE